MFFLLFFVERVLWLHYAATLNGYLVTSWHERPLCSRWWLGFRPPCVPTPSAIRLLSPVRTPDSSLLALQAIATSPLPHTSSALQLPSRVLSTPCLRRFPVPLSPPFVPPLLPPFPSPSLPPSLAGLVTVFHRISCLGKTGLNAVTFVKAHPRKCFVSLSGKGAGAFEGGGGGAKAAAMAELLCRQRQCAKDGSRGRKLLNTESAHYLQNWHCLFGNSFRSRHGFSYNDLYVKNESTKISIRGLRSEEQTVIFQACICDVTDSANI